VSDAFLAQPVDHGAEALHVSTVYELFDGDHLGETRIIWRMTIRVVVAEDNYLLREGMTRLLAAADGIEVVEACGSLEELLKAVADTAPHVVVTDIRMPPTGTDEGIRAATELRSSHPEIGVVVLSQYASPSYALALFEDGSDRRAYLLKDRVSELDDLVAAIRVVAEGGSVVDPKVVEELVRARSSLASSPLKHLTTREREVLAELATGKSNSAIAAALFLSERAVEKHSNAIFSKLGLNEEPDVNRRVKAVLVHLAATST
jgi:DNA-binding NarL/FixJ family response regulator